MHDQRIGERAGNAALEEIAVALACAQGKFWRHDQHQAGPAVPASRLLTEVTGAVVARIRPWLARMLLAHEAEFTRTNHQESADLRNYFAGNGRRAGTLAGDGKHSGRNALRMSLRDLGFEATGRGAGGIYRRVTLLADESKTVRSREYFGNCHEVIRRELRRGCGTSSAA